jgi:TatD DNase family protein
MFDTHSHLNLTDFADKEKQIINAARELGIKYFVIPGMDKDTSKKACEISDIYYRVYAGCGIHPTENLDNFNFETDLMWISKMLDKHKRIAAIGEIGLDYYHFNSAARLQILLLKEQLKIAIKTGLAVIIHNRQATKDIISTLNEYKDRLKNRVVFHCAEPEDELYDFASENDYYLGVDGDLTYDQNKQLFYKNIPLERIVLETDSPNLTPLPIRNEKRYPNEPKNLIYIAQKLAEIKNVSTEKIIKVTTQNAKNLFRIS